MSFIAPRNLRLAERSAGLRRELYSFLLTVTLWSVLMAIFSNAVFNLLQSSISKWVTQHLAMAVVFTCIAVLILAYLFLTALSHAITSSMGETRRSSVVFPLMYTETDMQAAAIDGYVFSREIRNDLAKRLPADWPALVRDAIAKNPGRPFGSEVYPYLAAALANSLLRVVARQCEFLLSSNAEFHGVDYGELAAKSGSCEEKEVTHSEGVRMYLPDGCRAEVLASLPNRFGRYTKCLLIHGPFGTVSFAISPQWPVLGPYHNLSLQFAKARLATKIKHYSSHEAGRLPSLWVLEVPVHINVSIKNRRNPLFFLSRRFTHMTEWLCDLLDGVEEQISWERFVDREFLRQTVREVIAESAKAVE